MSTAMPAEVASILEDSSDIILLLKIFFPDIKLPFHQSCVSTSKAPYLK